jgi:uncharacterized protein YmfQ (DUF2313 family)
MSDKHVRRSGDDYAQAMLSLLPQGQAWPKNPGTTLQRAITGLALYWGFVDARAADLLETESDPRLAVELFPDWERNWGLPDPCFFHDNGDLESRRAILMLKMTLIGGQSREFFMWVAERLGYTIHITEYAPFMAGISQVGDTRTPPLDPSPLVGEFRWYIGPPEMRFYWTVSVSGVSLIWFRATAGQAGVDPHLRIGIPEDLECLFNKWKPAHTQIVFDFSNMSDLGPMEGTP